jgi:hypothetical protein
MILKEREAIPKNDHQKKPEPKKIPMSPVHHVKSLASHTPGNSASPYPSSTNDACQKYPCTTHRHRTRNSLSRRHDGTEPWPRKVLQSYGGRLGKIQRSVGKADTCVHSKIAYRCCATDLDGDDGILQDVCAAAYPPPVEHDQVRSCWYVVRHHPGGRPRARDSSGGSGDSC